MRLRVPESLTERASRLIRKEILEGRLGSQQRLTEEFFAKRFGISKSPIREALNRLEAEGLIRIVPRRGAFVSDISVRDIEEIYEFREILEACVVRDIELDARTARRLEESIDAAEKYHRRKDKVNYVREDAAFHLILAEASPNSRVRKALEGMQNQMTILRHRTFALSSNTSVQQHRGILNALKRGDSDGAAELMVQHIRTVRDRLLGHLSAAAGDGASRRGQRAARDGHSSEGHRVV